MRSAYDSHILSSTICICRCIQPPRYFPDQGETSRRAGRNCWEPAVIQNHELNFIFPNVMVFFWNGVSVLLTHLCRMRRMQVKSREFFDILGNIQCPRPGLSCLKKKILHFMDIHKHWHFAHFAALMGWGSNEVINSLTGNSQPEGQRNGLGFSRILKMFFDIWKNHARIWWMG